MSECDLDVGDPRAGGEEAVAPGVRPLVLLAGFLGAGKTSFLRSLVPALLERGLRPRVILNDLENARIDAITLGNLRAELTTLTGNCLCCETQDELLAALRDQAVAAHDLVVLEVNGTTDTASLLEALAEATDVADRFVPLLQVTTVDALRYGRRDWMNGIEREQLATSSHVRVSKTDLVEAVRATSVRAAVTWAVPAARWTDADALAGELEDLASGTTTASHGPTDAALAGSSSSTASPPSSPPPAPPVRDHIHRHVFLSCQIAIPFPVEAGAFESFLRALPEQIVRAKGIVVLGDPPGEKRSFQLASGHAEVSPCKLQDPALLTPVAVFVGSGLDVPALRRSLAALEVTGSAGATPSVARRP